MEITLDDVIAEGNKVAARARNSATHTGELWGIPPSGKRMNTSIIFILEIADGKIVGEWDEFDSGRVLKQLGAVALPQLAAAT